MVRYSNRATNFAKVKKQLRKEILWNQELIKTNEETGINVLASVEIDPTIYVRKIGNDLEISR